MGKIAIIRLPYSERIIQKVLPHDGWVLQPAIKDWLMDNIGKDKWTWDNLYDHSRKTVGSEGNGWYIEFVFWEDNHALMFKLAWA